MWFLPKQKCPNIACCFPLLTVLQPFFGLRSPSIFDNEIVETILPNQLQTPITRELPIALGNYLGRLHHYRSPSER
jgi:hypothetical protein